MEMRKTLVLSFVLFSCYLILSLAPVSAYATGEFFTQADEKIARLSIDPVLKIIDELKPVECESQGTLGFRAYVENVGEFDITSMEALFEDATSGTYYNVTNAVSCGPRANLISNQEIVCTLNTKTLLAKLPDCPLESTVNRLYLSFDIAQEQSSNKVTDSKIISIIGSGIEPGMEVDFYVSRPPYPVPVINCNTGSEIDVPVVISHAERLYDSIDWSFAANGTSSNMIECGKLHSTEDEDYGRKDIYLCTLTVSSTMYPKCEDGAETTVGISARSGDFNLTGSFATTLTSQDLNLGLRISDIAPVDCQIIGQDGRCVPKDPQKNVTVTITGNVPERLKVFESRYKLANGNVSTLICKKLSGTRYQCMTFITLDNLPVPSTKGDVTTKEREMTIYFDVKYLNYYESISATKTFEMKGTALDELINLIELLNKDKDFYELIGDISTVLNKALWVINVVRGCCALESFRGSDGKLSVTFVDVIKKFAKNFFFGESKGGFDKALTVFEKFGPGIIQCIAEKMVEKIDEEIKNQQDFEKGAVNAEIEMPDLGDFLKNFPECTAKSFWDQLKSSTAVGWLCAIIMSFTGAGATICPILQNPLLQGIMSVIDAMIAIISILLQILEMDQAMKNIAISRESINLQLAASNSLTEYVTNMQNSIQMIASLVVTSAAIANITNPSYGTTKLLFISESAGMLSNGDNICTQDMITIEYDLEKLNQIEGFKPTIEIQSMTNAKKLYFDSLVGKYGPYSTDALLGTSPSDPSELYTFTLSYGDDKLSYQLNYVNHPCAT